MSEVDRSAIGRKSKRKGNKFEREVCKKMNDWWLGPDADLEFHRVPSSGGLGWRNRQDIFGDIVCPKDFPFIIECKNVNKWSFDQLLGNNKSETVGPIMGWVDQTTDAIDKCYEETGEYKFPLLIMTKNNYPIYVVYPIDQISLPSWSSMKDRIRDNFINNSNLMECHGLLILKLDDFLIGFKEFPQQVKNGEVRVS